MIIERIKEILEWIPDPRSFPIRASIYDRTKAG